MARVDGSQVLNPGPLLDQITWQQKSVTAQDSFGQDTYSWTDFVTCRAQIRALQGDELLRAQQYYALAKYQIIQHHYKGVTAAMRIAWLLDGIVLYLNVLNINPSPGMRLYQTILAKDYEA